MHRQTPELPLAFRTLGRPIEWPLEWNDLEQPFKRSQLIEESRHWDQYLGLGSAPEIERTIAGRYSKALGASAERRLSAPDTVLDQNLWIGLPFDSLVTSYAEFRDMAERLLRVSHPAEDLRSYRTDLSIVELGAGYGRLGHIIGSHPEWNWTYLGYELVPERVALAQASFAARSYSQVSLEVADLASPSFAPPTADCYFIYDFGSRPVIDKTFEDLRQVAQRRSIRVVGRGRSCRDAIEQGQPWLSQVNKPLHFSTYSIYES